MNATTISGWNLLDTAHEALRSTVRGISAADLDRPTPCSEWTVAQVLQHATGDQLAYAAAITGGPGPDFNPFAPSGTLDGEPLALLEPALTACTAAWATVDRDAAEAPVPVPPGSLAPWLGAGAAALDAAVHAWDIAAATGQDSPLTPGLAGELHKVATEIVEPLRQFGAFAAAIEAPGDEVADLLHYLGRDPAWTA
ncbi:TIGR03086 family metal-binding protein [Actinomadura opuntiae]|uniref:TIGR03086 family metal-binding protein n=1 Tax=Actinomadura sp. OS1-43 TaxID=604315 RepID=UPI00255B3B28|nr:TIGR03086 family metal-binding protein [Actinomadura sp. OS1-43]MDL4820802.1 TIGR03086 family metal-binding protein [Actinomadura sp. OS1-43]